MKVIKKSRNKNLSGRYRNWFIITYDDPALCLKSLLAQCEHYAYAYHDKDTKADGTADEPHYHVCCVLANAKTATAVMSCNEGSQNIFPDAMTNRLSSFRYLTHKDNKDKYQYPDDIIVSNDIYYWRTLTDTPVSRSGENIINICADINAGKSYEFLVMTYGHYYFANREKLESFAEFLKREKYLKYSDAYDAIRNGDDDDFPY